MIQVSLRSLLLLLVVITLPLSGIYNRYNGKRTFAEFLNSAVNDNETPIGVVRWSYQLDSWYDYVRRAPKYHGPEWIRSLFGDDAMAYIKRASVSVDSDENSDTLSRLLSNGDSLRGLQELRIQVENGIEFDCQCLSGLNDVRTLTLDGITLEKRNFHAISEMKDLEILFVSGCQFKASDVEPLAAAPHLAWMQISREIGVTKEMLLMREQLPQVYISYDSRQR